MKSWILILTTLPASAFAGSYCDDAAKLRQSVSYCHENFVYVAPARACRDRFNAAAKAKQEEIQKILASDLRKSNQNAQQGNFQASEKVLTSADQTLKQLIDQGKDTHTEIEDYAYDMVMPMYDDDDFRQNPDDPKVQAEMRQEECYGMPMEELDAVKTDLEKTIASLQKAKTSVDQLLALAKTRDSGLGGSSAAPAAAKGVSKAAGPKAKNGAAPKGASDITGVKETEQKDKQAPGGQ